LRGRRFVGPGDATYYDTSGKSKITCKVEATKVTRK
jgi:hypothetical protein